MPFHAILRHFDKKNAFFVRVKTETKTKRKFPKPPFFDDLGNIGAEGGI